MLLPVILWGTVSLSLSRHPVSALTLHNLTGFKTMLLEHTGMKSRDSVLGIQSVLFFACRWHQKDHRETYPYLPFFPKNLNFCLCHQSSCLCCFPLYKVASFITSFRIFNISLAPSHSGTRDNCMVW